MARKKISHQISPNFENSHFCCWDCKRELLQDEIDDLHYTVKCPFCGGTMHVYAKVRGWNRALIKKYVWELVEGDLVLLRDMESHEVLDITEEDDNIYKVALKGYTVIRLEGDDDVKCVMGTWMDGETPWKCED